MLKGFILNEIEHDEGPTVNAGLKVTVSSLNGIGNISEKPFKIVVPG